MIQRGYECRHRYLWAATRWQTYNIMAAQVGSEGLHKAGIYKATDLMQFPWEREQTTTRPITEEEQQELIDLMASINAQNAAKAEKSE